MIPIEGLLIILVSAILRMVIINKELTVKQHAQLDFIEILWQRNVLFQQVAQLLLDSQTQQLETVLQIVQHHIMHKILLKCVLLTVDLLMNINTMEVQEAAKISVQTASFLMQILQEQLIGNASLNAPQDGTWNFKIDKRTPQCVDVCPSGWQDEDLS